MGVLRDIWDFLSPLWGLFGLAALTAGTFVFVAGEFALTTLERSTVDAHVQQVGDRRSRQVQHARNTLSFQLSGAQVGITITTLLTGYVAQPAIAGLIRPALQAVGLSTSAVDGVSLGVGLTLATALSMVFGELVPQNLAISRPLQTARQVAGVVNAFSLGFRWLIATLNGAANWIVRRLGIEPAEDLRSARSPQELGSLVRSSAAQGTLDQGTATLLDRSLRFGERTAEELKIAVGSAVLMKEPLVTEVRGRDLVSGLPKNVQITSNDVTEAIQEPLRLIVGAVRDVLEETPPELAADIFDRGIVLSGGGALLPGLDRYLAMHTGIPTVVADDPQTSVVRGTGLALENFEVLKRNQSYLR